jgi:hypothetical protein
MTYSTTHVVNTIVTIADTIKGITLLKVCDCMLPFARPRCAVWLGKGVVDVRLSESLLQTNYENLAQHCFTENEGHYIILPLLDTTTPLLLANLNQMCFSCLVLRAKGIPCYLIF